MPRLIRFVIRESLLGFAIGIVLTVVLVLLNVGGLREMLEYHDRGLALGLLLTVSNGLVCAAGQVAVRVFLMADAPGDEER